MLLFQVAAFGNTSRGTVRGKKSCACGPAEGPRRRRGEKEKINQRQRKIVELKSGVTLKNCGDGTQNIVSKIQDRPRRKLEVFPRDEGESDRADRAYRLRQNDDPLSTVTIGHVSGRERQQNYWRSDGRAGQAECSRGVRARINFPLDSDR